MKKSFFRLAAFALAAVLCIASMSSCTIQDRDQYAGLNEFSAPNAKHGKSVDGRQGEEGENGVSVTDLPATFPDTGYVYDPKTGKMVPVSSPDMYTSKIPDTYVVSGYVPEQSDDTASGSQSDNSNVPTSSETPPTPIKPTVPTTGASGEAAELSSAQRQKLITLISSDLLDNESFENDTMTTDHMLAAGLLLGSGDIEQGFDTSIGKDALIGHCRDLFGINPVSGSKVSSSYVTLKGDKFIIKKMPQSNYYSKNIEGIYDLGNDYYKVTAQLMSDGRSVGSAVYIVMAKASAPNGFVIIAQNIK